MSDKESGEGTSDAPENQEKDTTTDQTSERKDDQAKQSKEETSDNDNKYIKLKVVGNDQNGIHFRLKMSTQLLKLKKSYSTHVGVPVNGLRFLFDGKRIGDEDTPKQLDMRDDDQIEVYHEQTGGCSGSKFSLEQRASRELHRHLTSPANFDYLPQGHGQDLPSFFKNNKNV